MGLKVFTGQGDGHTPGGYYRSPKEAEIDPNNEESLTLWQRSLELTRAELIEAIKHYGTSVRNIRRGLVEEKRKSA